MTNKPVLIAGAGPTGLVLGLGLARAGVPFRLISKATGPGEHSRAMVVHARTLEFYRQFGFADEVIAKGVKTQTVHLRDGSGREGTTFHFKDLGDGISPYPFLLTFPQDDHERLLVEKLAGLGGQVEWNARLTGFVETDAGVRATISHADGRAEEADFSYVCGCDGARSQVRRTLGLGFPGGTYEQLFYVADVRIDSGFTSDMFVHLGEHILALMFPVRSSGMQRLIGLVPPALSARQDLAFEDIRDQVEPLLNVRVTEVNWFSTYRVHHRVAERFQVGRAFLLGDAGHVHSPAGGQGMNTGIGDAINLGWKLAHVLRGRAAPALLDTYQTERIGFARKLVATTDRAFTPMVAGGLRGEFTRRILAPMAISVMTRFAVTRHAAFRLLSQTHIHYEDSPLSEGAAGYIVGGDRLPWSGGSGADNFAPLESCEWQVHVHGEVEAGLRDACAGWGLSLRVFPWTEPAQHAGFRWGATYLVRPDGYVALAAISGSVILLRSYIKQFALRF